MVVLAILVGSSSGLVARSARAVEARGHAEGALGQFLPIDDAWQARELGPGVVGSLGAELGLSTRVGLEARLLGGVFPGIKSPSDPGIKKTDAATLVGGMFGVRLHLVEPLKGVWLGTGFGPVATGGEVRLGVDVRVGYDFRVGQRLQAGPWLGYLHVMQPDSGLRPEDGRALLLGAHFGLDEGPVKPAPVAVYEPPVTPPPPPPPPIQCPAGGCEPPADTTLLGALDRCPSDPDEYVGSVDADGCVREVDVKVIGDDILFDDRVFFEFRLARVRVEAMPILRSLVALIRAHPEYSVIHVDGHADEIGSPLWNQKLSEARAANVQKLLVSLGVPAKRIRVKGYGQTKPWVQGSDESTRGKNRRVEFRIERHGEVKP